MPYAFIVFARGHSETVLYLHNIAMSIVE